MHRIKLEILLLGWFLLSFASSAIAADPGTTPTRTPIQQKPTIELAPKFTCSINPPTGKSGSYLTTAVTVKKISGSIKWDTEVLIKLGLAPTGTNIAHICGYQFVSDTATIPQVFVPAISDPNYIWYCNAVVGKRRCKPQPQPPPQR
jgi:hypothetical protein